eukprot:1042767_1
MKILSLFALFCHFCMFHGDDEFTLIAINVSSRKRTMTTFMPYNTSHTSHSSHCESRYQGRNAIFDMFMHHTHGDHSQANASELNTHNNAALLLFAFISLSKSTQLQHMLAVFIALNFVGSRAAYYVFESTAMPWEAAETYCQSTYGTHLATIWDDDAARELLTYTPTFWIGLNDRNVEGTWEYADGSNSLCGGDCGGSYAYWHPNEPNDAGGEDCAVKEVNAADIMTMVVDHPCTSEWPFACNKPTAYYLFESTAMTWEAAETHCQSTYGTNLATIWDDDAARELLTYTPTFWIGLNDRNVEGTWEYADGSNSLCGGDCGGSYAYWHPNEPNDAGGEDCAVKEVNAADIMTMVVDHPCTSEWPFACNKPTAYYLFESTAMTWETAETHCQSTYGTNLATIWNDLAARELLTYTPTFWIGLNDRNVEGTWEYADGSNSLC